MYSPKDSEPSFNLPPKAAPEPAKPKPDTFKATSVPGIEANSAGQLRTIDKKPPGSFMASDGAAPWVDAENVLAEISMIKAYIEAMLCGQGAAMIGYDIGSEPVIYPWTGFTSASPPKKKPITATEFLMRRESVRQNVRMNHAMAAIEAGSNLTDDQRAAFLRAIGQT